MALPRTPDKVYKYKGWTGWTNFLDKVTVCPYETYEEAKSAVRQLDVSKQSDYLEKYKADPRLRSTPHRIYSADWKDWYDYLGTDRNKFYNSYSEAKSAAVNLGITKYTEYVSRYREDPRLPRHPGTTYENVGWTKWGDFLRQNARFHSYEEAKQKVLELGVTSGAHYVKVYKCDPKLPGCPAAVYKGKWPGWANFLGKDTASAYASYSEAKVAAQNLNITTSIDYRRRYLEDPKLPSRPSDTYKDKGWENWYKFFDKPIVEFYATYLQAKEAASSLGITGMKDYHKRYRFDPRLPSTPSYVYANKGWVNWYEFTDRAKPDFYESYAEACSAVKKLAIVNSSDYMSRYQEDPKLPSTPHDCYKNDWIDWFHFLSNPKRRFYKSYIEAKSAVAQLEIRTIDEYTARYREDELLPAYPSTYYHRKGWTDWYDYFGRERKAVYPNYSQARAAARQLRVATQREYSIRYKEDEQLPGNPHKVYASEGWEDWYDFLGLVKPIDVQAEYPALWSEVKKWLDNETNRGQKSGSLRTFLIGFCRFYQMPDEIRYFLLRENNFNVLEYQNFIESISEGRKRQIHSHVVSFYNWALNEYCTDTNTDTDTDEVIILPGCRNPFSTIVSGFMENLPPYRPSQSTKTPLGYEFILRARQFLVPNSESSFITRPSLTELRHLQDLFNTRPDWIEVDEGDIDAGDPDCVYRVITGRSRTIDGKIRSVDVYQIWSPVRFIALYTLLRYPLRGQQILWLDSGEADDEIPILDSSSKGLSWVKNPSKLVLSSGKKNTSQSAIQRGATGHPKFYITTNKTSRAEGGYTVEWIPEDLLYWLIKLRDWQAKYNPILKPTPWVALDRTVHTNRKILKARGSQCFLFRTGNEGHPIVPKSAFDQSLPALLNLIQRPGENLSNINPDPLNSRYICPYTPHSLRVSLITAFIADGEAPIHLISKLVGHASLVMTIYYIRLNHQQMRSAMGEAEKRAALVVTEKNMSDVLANGLDPIKQTLIKTDGNGSLIEEGVPNSACVVFDWGICPMSAASCFNGGEAIFTKQRENLHSPVEFGYLGQKNCVRCRYFVTGVPFLGGLVALGNEIALEIHVESGRFQEFSAEVKRLEEVHYDACQANQPDIYLQQRKQAIANEQQSGSKLDNLLKDYTSIHEYIKLTLKLTDERYDSEGKLALIATDSIIKLDVSVRESASQYHLLAEICENAQIYRFSNASRALPLISQAIDRMAANNGLLPSMYRLTERQKLTVVQQLNKLLLLRLGSWERIDDLFSGNTMLMDIDAQSIDPVCMSREIQLILSAKSMLPLEQEIIYE